MAPTKLALLNLEPYTRLVAFWAPFGTLHKPYGTLSKNPKLKNRENP